MTSIFWVFSFFRIFCGIPGIGDQGVDIGNVSAEDKGGYSEFGAVRKHEYVIRAFHDEFLGVSLVGVGRADAFFRIETDGAEKCLGNVLPSRFLR